ncbi:MAG: dephospho-CoA kinase [Gammaproteobacteria bacterium]
MAADRHGADTRQRDWPVWRVGLTGGIASGKSTVATMFAALGVPVIDSDVIAREVVEPGTPGLAAVVAAFGPAVLLPDGTLDRRRLRELAFETPARRQQLEASLHPRIRERMEALCAASGGPYQLLVIPLLLESGLESRVDRVLVVDCSEDVQRARLTVRDGESAAGVERLLAAQLDRQARVGRADDILANDGSRDDLQRGVRELHARFLQLAAKQNQGGVKGHG